MDLHLIRDNPGPSSTIGTLLIADVFECFILENPIHLNALLGPEHIAIPYGRFRIDLHLSHRFKRIVPILLDVPGRTAIEIHPGNATKDTHGCLLPGKTRAKNFVGNSREAFEALVAKIENMLKSEEVWLSIEHAPLAEPEPKVEGYVA